MVKFLVISCIVVTIAFAVIREMMNYIEHPSLQIIRYPEDSREIILYHKGTRGREATLFVRALGAREQPARIARIDYSEVPDDSPIDAFGQLRWTNDGTSVVATRRPTREDPEMRALWIYDVGSQTMYETGAHRGGTVVSVQHMNWMLNVKGGLGTRIVEWRELGQKANYVYSWKARHWDRLAGAQDDHQDENDPLSSETPSIGDAADAWPSEAGYSSE